LARAAQVSGFRQPNADDVPLQNRVTPFGELVAIAGRGQLMGNRGVLHDANRTIVRPWALRRWIACRTAFRGRHRAVMQPRRWTELFFLDAATAFAAGHRPCAQCRFADFERFRTLWETRHGTPTTANSIDRILHAERLDGRRKRTYRARVESLPDGTSVALAEGAWVIRQGELHGWSGDGYVLRRPRPRSGAIVVLTPPSIVAGLSAGYPIALHGSHTDALR